MSPSPSKDLALFVAREAASEGLSEFQANLKRFESGSTPQRGKGPVPGAVPLPGMGRPSPGGIKKPGAMGKPGAMRDLGKMKRPGAKLSGLSAQEEARLQKVAEQAALQVMMTDRLEFVSKLFEGTKLVYKSGRSPAQDARKAAGKFAVKAAKTGSSAKKKADKGSSWTSSMKDTADRPSPKAARDLGKKVLQTLGEIDPSEMESLLGPVEELAGDLLVDLGSSLLPFVGTAKAGARAGSKWGGVVKKQVQVKRTEGASQVMIKGDPEQAILAIKRCLQRERNELSAEAGMATAKLGMDVAGYFVDFGIASQIATSCADIVGRLTLQIRKLVRDARELKAANELLVGGTVDARIFTACPLLGAYAVASADTSAIVGFLGGDPQRHGFSMDDLEALAKKHNRTLVKYATDLIAASRLEVRGMPTNLASIRAKVKTDSGLKQRIKRSVQQKLKMAGHKA